MQKRAASLMLVLFAATAVLAQTAPQYPNYPSETPAKFAPPTTGMDFTRREEMIPMRDGVKLRTVSWCRTGPSTQAFS